MKHILTPSIAILICTNAIAQNSFSITGTVKDSVSEEPLAGAEFILQGTVYGAVSSQDGIFIIKNIPHGEYTLLVSFVGYAPISKQIAFENNEIVHLDFLLSPTIIEINDIMVEADKPYSAASSRLVREIDMKLRPTRSAQDLLQLAPGLIIAQHAGGGKAEQIFMRGFDADHGTDVAIDVDGIPVNMVSHGHGQGYADLHFLIPEIVENISVHKGPYFARYGNFATAGAVSFTTKDHLESNVFQAEQGSFATSKITTALQIPTAGEHQNAYFAAQLYKTDGPFDVKQGFNRFNLFGKFHSHLTRNSKIMLAVGAFSSAWDASGQIPQRAIDEGIIDRWGSIDPFEGGTTGRQNFNLEYYLKSEDNSDFKIQTYFTNYDFKLFSNFTLFLNDSIDGDMIEQVDDRNILGVNTQYCFSNMYNDMFFTTKVATGFRSDNVKLNLWKSPARIREEKWVDSYVAERNFYLWMEQEILFGSQFRLQVGLRDDFFTFNVNDFLDDTAGLSLPHASGYYQKSIVSPKLNFVYSPVSNLDIFVNAGTGFHSNDARDIVIRKKTKELVISLKHNGDNDQQIAGTLAGKNYNAEDYSQKTLSRATGAELGFRTHLFKNINLAVAAWILDLDKELVYVGDEGTTEISGATRRVGIDIEARIQLLSRIWIDSDLNLSDGHFKNLPAGEDEIPLAPRLTSTGGITFLHPSGIEAALRYRYIGNRPANEDNSVVADGYTVVNLNTGYKLGDIKFMLFVENIFDTEWNEAQFDTESRLRNEATSVSEIHFTPGNPRNIRMGLRYDF